MFKKTLTKGTGAIVGLQEVTQPSHPSHRFHVASIAGNLLAGYFPQPHSGFSFPPHWAALSARRSFCDAPQCSASQRCHQIASLLCGQGAVADAVKSASAHESSSSATLDRSLAIDEDQSDADAARASIKPAPTDVDRSEADAARTSVVATLMAREYGPKIQRLEQHCLSLYTSNQQLQRDASQTQLRFDKTRELNRQLCREVQEVRSERTAAVEELERLREEARQARSDALQVRCENDLLRESLRDAKEQLLELSKVELAMPEAAKAKSSAAKVDDFDDVELPIVVRLEPEVAQSEHLNMASECHAADAACRCHLDLSWGCPSHRIYSDSLLLAHREVSNRIAKGPPGLCLDAPPGLEGMMDAAERHRPWGLRLAAAH